LWPINTEDILKYKTLSEIQKKNFLEISGVEYQAGELKGQFNTNRAYNDSKGEGYSPWIFSYVIEPDTGFLICELEHRMTNNRIYGWDREGNELPLEILGKHFTPHL